MVTAVIQQEHYLTNISAGNNLLVADEPLANGGGDKGFAPQQLLAAALASCTSITLRMYADRKHWEAGIIEVNVEIEKDAATGETRFERKIRFSGNLSDEETEKMLQIADSCPVHKILTNKIVITTSL